MAPPKQPEEEDEATKLVRTLITALQNINTANNNTIEKFDEQNESIANYFLRLENYFTSRGIQDEANKPSARVQFVLNHLSAKHHRIVQDLCSPESPSSKTYDTLKQTLQQYFDRTINEVIEQHRFNQRLQGNDESVNKYATELKNIAALCNFTCHSCQASTSDVHLRSQFIRGIKDADVRRELLRQKPTDLTFTKAVELAVVHETSKLGADQIHTTNSSAVPNFSHPPKINKFNVSERGNKRGRGRGNSRRGGKQFNLQNCCYRCGEQDHRANQCTHSKATCTKCGRTGHLDKVCQNTSRGGGNVRGRGRGRGRGSQKYYNHNQLEVNTTTDQTAKKTDAHEFNYFNYNLLQKDGSGRLLITMEIEGYSMQLEFDTGAAVTAIPVRDFNQIATSAGIKLRPTTAVFKGYGDHYVTPLGMVDVRVKYNSAVKTVIVYVVENKYSAVLGREWIDAFDMLPGIKSIITDDNRESECEKIVQEYSSVFQESIGVVPNFKCSLPLRDNAVPVFHKPYQLPFAIKPLVDKELDSLEAAGIISKAEHANWGTPIVPVINESGKVRICGNYKATINKYMIPDPYPIPRLQEIFTKLSGGNYFISLDIYRAYLHLTVDTKTAELQCISTHRGPYLVNRLMFGIQNAPGIWQRFMENLLMGVEGTSCFYDDIKIQGRTISELLHRFRLVLDRLQANGLHLNKKKCQFSCSSIRYLGFLIDRNGIHKTPEKIATILKSNPPRNVTELRSFIGLVNYYNMFLQNLSTLLAPLNALLQKNVPFQWDKRCQLAFQKLKEQMAEDKILVPYNPDYPLILATDASPYGIGACLSHVIDGVEKPIAFASRTLTPAEKNYSQLDREATAIFWSVKYFFIYLYGRHFTLYTDHKPLAAIFNAEKSFPPIVAARLLRYAQFLGNFTFTIKYRSADKHANADFPSRFPLENSTSCNEMYYVTVLCMEQLQVLPVSAELIATETKKDDNLRGVYMALQSKTGLQGTIFEGKDSEFSIENNCIFRGTRVVIPTVLQEKILQELHTGHLGIVRMKSLAREYVYWKDIDSSIERFVRSCQGCAKVQNNPAKIKHPWLYPEIAWYRLHADFAGPFQNYNFLLVVDAYSKWLEVFIMKSITTSKTIEHFNDLFARFGLPVTLVTDNGPQWTSAEFQQFISKNGIIHKRSAPYNPSSNGQVERYVQALKRSLKAMSEDNNPTSAQLQQNVNEFLIQQRRSIHSFTGASPADLIFKHQYRTKIDLVRSNLTTKIREEQLQDIANNVPVRELPTNVRYRVYNSPTCKWDEGTIVEQEGPLNYKIKGSDGTIHRRHSNQLVPSVSLNIPETSPTATPTKSSEKITSPQVDTDSTKAPTPVPLRRSERNVKKPVRLDL